MPSDRPQLNVRLEPDVKDRFEALLTRVSAAVGVTLSQSQLVALALKALEEKYPPRPDEPKRKK